MHPLELPELLHRVGWFTASWKPSKKGVFDFYPKDLIACTEVNHTWRRLMMPLLWAVYDEWRMECWNIPKDILQAASEHFRFISLGSPWPDNTVRASRLKELRIWGRALINNLQLLHNNPQLTLLRIWFSDDRAMQNKIQPAVESLTRLQSLFLDFLCPESWDHVTRVLNNNPDLKRLELRHPLDITDSNGCGPLAQLTLLHFTGSWDLNPGILQLIQLCPQLKRFEFSTAGCPTKQLVTALRESCPFLNAIQCEGFIDEEDALLLVRAATRLLHIELRVTLLSAHISDALLSHAGWIETLKLRLREGHEMNSRSLTNILDQCTNLRSLDIAQTADLEYPDPGLNWIGSPWNTPHLETIELLGLTYPYVSGAVTNMSLAISSPANSEPRAQRQEAIESRRGLANSCLDQGWVFDRCATAGYDDKRISDSARAIRDAVFQRVSDYPRMHKIVIEDFTFVNKSRVPLKK